VLEEKYWKPVLETVQERLLTPLGLRTLSRDHTDYKAKYFGDLRARDAAYHQGTVWAWLMGPFHRCLVKSASRRAERSAKVFGRICAAPRRRMCGSINEIFDAEPPYTRVDASPRPGVSRNTQVLGENSRMTRTGFKFLAAEVMRRTVWNLRVVPPPHIGYTKIAWPHKYFFRAFDGLWLEFRHEPRVVDQRTARLRAAA